jgi:hypothetical protein
MDCSTSKQGEGLTMSNSEPAPSGLVVIARGTTGQIVTRITSHRDLVGALHTGRCILKLKLDAVCIEVHHGEDPTSAYCGKPLAVVSQEDLLVEHRSV